MEERDRKRRQAGFRRRRMLMKKQLQEEDDQLACFPEIEAWIKLIQVSTARSDWPRLHGLRLTGLHIAI
eukprot:scaffold3988_cov243-Pinguiococcus_pyrenoidosus.AAC.2